MKPITIRFWVPEDTPTAAIDGSGVKVAAIRAWLMTLDQEYTSAQQLTDEEISKIADGIAEREYRDTVQGIIDDVKGEVANGTITDRDSALEYIEQTIDGHHDVIYTYAAQNVCRISRNDGAYFDDFGSEGAVEDGGIAWSKLAYCAMRADVLEQIGDLDEWFRCSECSGEVTAKDLKLAGTDELPVCEDCRAEDEPGEEPGE